MSTRKDIWTHPQEEKGISKELHSAIKHEKNYHQLPKSPTPIPSFTDRNAQNTSPPSTAMVTTYRTLKNIEANQRYSAYNLMIHPYMELPRILYDSI